jgi:hypothetical protein
MFVGDIEVSAVSDGTFVARPSYFGSSAPDHARPEFFERGGAAWLPIGSFLIRDEDRVLLVDAGLGPELKHLPDGMLLVGGQLLTGLAALGIRPAGVTDVICTHLHSDHVGWLFVGDAITCPIQLAEPTWHSFGDVDAALAQHTRRRLWRELADEHTLGIGAHFPQLAAGRVSSGRWIEPPSHVVR